MDINMTQLTIDELGDPLAGGCSPSAPKIEIWTDGSIYPNPGGVGGWGVVLRYQRRDRVWQERELFGNSPSSTNNRMEITAIIKGLQALKRPCNVIVYTDSEHTQRCASGVYRRNANTDLWDELFATIKKGRHDVDIRHVYSHGKKRDKAQKLADRYGIDLELIDELNDRCDKLANKGRLSYNQK